MSTKAQKFDRYKHYADKAVKAEQEGNYAEAKDHWEIAKLSATSDKNQHWAEQRAEFCKRMHNKPF
ncbi:ANR family transcriptional regulator [Avibacterium sp. 20-129]|uniref:ANR family transcriptional regulator n=1 Tax=Avibacterium sp. 20-129 TaxID=2911525 RepID=UPI002248653E|nr:ANR family transcriptional regulator [Avibacterium sp. 20-129]MCW9698175.1 ANR family transcriptional regulator [Avibacterium sp. 20-129]